MWSIFEASYNAEETINNEFCAHGIFKISNSDVEPVETFPHILAYVQNGRMVIAIDNIILLLENENIAECKYISFDSKINALSTSNSGNIIICGLCDGTIIGLCIKGFPVFRQRINEDDIKDDKTFVGIKMLENNSFYLTCTNGSIYYLYDIKEDNLENLINNNNTTIQETVTITFDQNSIEDAKLILLTNNKSLNVILSNEITSTNNNILDQSDLSFIAGTKCFLKFCNNEEELKIILPNHYNGIKNIYNLDNYILALSNSGHLFEICSLTKMIYDAYDLQYLIDDIVVMENNNETIEFLILTKMENEAERYMKIIDFPSFKCNFDVEVPANCWLIKQPKSSVNLYYLVSENLNENNLPMELEMKIISETDPQQKLIKLIHKGHLEEAEAFGKQFELSLQPIYEAKIRRCILEIRNNDGYDFLEKEFQKLNSILKVIENKEFFVQIRYTEFSDRKILKKFLNEILIHLKNDKLYEEHFLSVKEQLLRLETFDIIDPFDCNSEWSKFIYHTDLVKYCQVYFKTDVLVSSLIWKRHSSSIIPHLTEHTIRKLLEVLPTNIEPFEIIQWLRNFIPTVLQSFPSSMLYLVDWCYRKTVLLQFSTHWPEIGLEFSTKILEIFRDVEFLQIDINRRHEAGMEKLNKLVFALQDLSVLKKTYNLVQTLENYEKDSIDESAFNILQRVQTDRLEDVISNFLYPIFMKKGKTPISVIIKYVQFLVDNRCNFSSWVERCIVLIELLHNEEDKLECGLYVLKNLPLPWPDTVKDLVQLRSSSHPLGKEIQNLCEIQIIEAIKVKYNWPISDDNYIKFVYHIVKQSLPSMINDIHDLTNTCTKIESHANVYCCFELARVGKFLDAVNFFTTLDEEKKKDCSDSVMNICLAMVSNIENDHITNDDIIDFCNFISVHSSLENQKRFIVIKNTKLLFNELGVKAENLEILDQRKREELMLQGIENIVNNIFEINDLQNIVQYIWQKISILSNALELKKSLGVLNIAKYLNNLHLSCALAYNIIELIDCTPDNVDYIIEFGVFIIYQQIMFDIEDKSSANNPLTYPLVNKLLVKCLKHKNMVDLYHIFIWINIGTYGIYDLNVVQDYYKNMKEINCTISEILLKKTDSTVLESDSHYMSSVFDNFIEKKNIADKPSSNATSVTKCLSFAIFLTVITNKDKNFIYKILNSYLTEVNKDSIEKIKEKLFYLLHHLIKTKQYKIWFSICTTFYPQQNKGEYIMSAQFISSQLKKIFRYLLAQNIELFNFGILFAMLKTNKDPEIFLRTLWDELPTDQQKINYLIVSEKYYSQIKLFDNAEKSRKIRMKYFYFGELCKLDPNFRKNVDINVYKEIELLNQLKSKTLDIDFLKSLTTDGGGDYQELLESQILTVLQNEKLKYEIKTDAFGKEELIMKTTVQDIFKLCQPYLNEIENGERLGKKLYKLFQEIHYYYYELYLCVIEILTFCNQLVPHFIIYSNILKFLQYKMRFRRIYRPGPEEKEAWLHFQLESGILPQIAKYRLPFLPIVMKPLKDYILSNEINIDNCESWFPLVRLHVGLSDRSSLEDITRIQDYFCMQACKKSIKECDDNETETINLKPKNNAFLQGIVRLMKHVSDKSTIFLILYYVTNYAPEGADQVEAAYECYKFAIENENDLMEKNQKELMKIKRKYPIFKTQHLLRLYGLNEDNLMQLVESPKELINALYHHPSILKSKQIDINKIAGEVAELHDLTISSIQCGLLQKWFTFSAENDFENTDETFYEDFNNSTSYVEDFSNDNIIRAYYILKSWDSVEAMEYLLAKMYPDSDKELIMPSDKQLHMLEVFAKLIDNTDSVADYLNVINQQIYITCKCVYYLKQLGYNFTIDKFKDHDKLDILEKLWSNHKKKPLALEIMANICIGFDIHNPKVWNAVLSQMINLNMLNQLNALVDQLSCNPQLINIEGLKLAWQFVLIQPFKNAIERKLDEEERLAKGLFRIQSCPLVSNLKLLEIAEDCIQIKRPHLAAILLGLCHENEKESIRLLIKPHLYKTLKKDITSLKESGILDTIINTVLKQLKL